MKDRKRLLLIFAAIVLLAGIVLLGIILLNKNNKGQQDDSVPTRSIQETEREVQAYTADKVKKSEQIASQVQQPSDLDGYSSDEQASVAILIIYDSIESGDTAKAKAFAEYLMKRNDADGLLGSKLCYKLAETETEKQLCKNRATEQAVSQEIITAGTILPDSYMMLKEGDE